MNKQKLVEKYEEKYETILVSRSSSLIKFWKI